MISGGRLEIRFPRAGVVRALGYHEAAGGTREAYPTPWAVNCRPLAALDRRRRGGSRSGIAAGGSALPTPAVHVTSNSATVYNAATGATSVVVASAGVMPAAFTFGAMYRGRLLLVGGKIVHCSRAGGVTDWDYAADVKDPGRAKKFQLSEATEYGDDVTAIVPHKDRNLLLASAAELWALAGDPVTGQFQNVSRLTGIIGPKAWTLVDDTVVFMADDGLWSVGANGSGLKQLSVSRVPDDLRDLSGANTVLAYSPTEQGVYVFCAGATYQWFYDLVDGGFWPMTMTTVPDYSCVVDGVLRLSASGTAMQLGGTESIESGVILGPLKLSSKGGFGIVQAMNGTIATGSGSVTWAIVPGESAEQAAERAKGAVGGTQTYVAASGTLSAGRSWMVYPRVRAPWACVVLTSSASWAYESIVLDILPTGDWR